jgi:hypothetical protein
MKKYLRTLMISLVIVTRGAVIKNCNLVLPPTDTTVAKQYLLISERTILFDQALSVDF